MVSIARPSVGGNRRIQIALDPESYELVQQIAEAEERSVSAVAGRLIRHALSGLEGNEPFAVLTRTSGRRKEAI